MAGYGFHTFTAAIGGQLLNQTPSGVDRTFFALPRLLAISISPLRLLNSTIVELTARVAVISGSKTAELAAREETEAIAKLGIDTNRYCLMLFMPLAIFLSLYGYELIRIWIGQVFADQSAPAGASDACRCGYGGGGAV